jgi:predicted nucleic acid-binding protein
VICVDASLVLAFLLRDEEFSAHAAGLFAAWRTDREELIAPALLPFEVLSGLRLAVFRSRISKDEGDAQFVTFQAMPIELRRPSGLSDQTWDIGKRMNPPRLYDASYLALANIQDCDVWTADRRFVRLMAARSPRLRWAGDREMVKDG